MSVDGYVGSVVDSALYCKYGKLLLMCHLLAYADLPVDRKEGICLVRLSAIGNDDRGQDNVPHHINSLQHLASEPPHHEGHLA